MGITLDNSIETLSSILAEATANEDAVCYVTSADAPALKRAIETMRKYQKIEKIVNNNPDYVHHTDLNTYKVNSIKEVLEDGKND